jgi:uncharacterized protein YkwD
MIIAAPLSLNAETRRPGRTDMAQLAAELDAALRRAHARRDTVPARQELPATSISRQDVVDAMNVYRRQHGLAPLRLDERLNAAADDRSRDMFKQRYFDHVAPDGRQPFEWVKYRNYRYSTAGENLAEGQRSAAQVARGWMDSPGHRANILGRSFEDVGVSIVRGSPTGRTNGYTFVALYAREGRTTYQTASRAR